MADRLIVAVNGYGAPEDPETDENLTRYLNRVMSYCQKWPHKSVQIHLLGGYTNRTTLTEARAMELWIEARGRPRNIVSIVLHEDSTDLRGNCRAMQDVTKDNCEIVYFCEASRWPATNFLVRRYLGQDVEVVGIPFDHASLSLKHALLQRFPKYWLEWTAEVFGGPFERLRQRQRARHIDKHRQLAEKTP